MLRFLLLFLFLLTALFLAELWQPVEQHVIVPFTSAIAQVCVFIVDLFDANAIAHGKILQSTRNDFAISIERGCNGIEAVIILVSAMLAFPAPWKHKLAGIAVGVPLALAFSLLLGQVLLPGSPLDPRVHLAVIGLLLLVVVLAALLPARRALRVDPMVALRDE